MPLSGTDLKIKLSTTAGAAGNSTAGTPNSSLGKYISTTELVDNNLDNLFDDVSGAENSSLESEYRCVFVHNAHATLTYLAPVVYLLSEVAGGAVLAIGVDPTAASAIGSAGAQAVQVADENTAPAGVAFSSPTTLGTGLALGDIGPGQCKAVWVRRTTTDSAAITNDGGTLRVQGDSL